MSGRYCTLEPLAAGRHGQALEDVLEPTQDSSVWTYLPYGPFLETKGYTEWLEKISRGADPLFFTILDEVQRVRGLVSFMRIDPPNGVIEIGHVIFCPLLQRTRSATESIFLLISRAFDELGYRRLEWKCDSLNEPSRRAAERYGFQFEGIFRQNVVYKNRSRDTAWYSIIDVEWPPLRQKFEAWLRPENFDEQGRQRKKLECRT